MTTVSWGQRTPVRPHTEVHRVKHGNAWGVVCSFHIQLSERVLQQHFIFMLDHDMGAMWGFPCLFQNQVGAKLKPLIHSNDINDEIFYHKPLNCFAVCDQRLKRQKLNWMSLSITYNYSVISVCVAHKFAKQEECGVIRGILIGTLNHQFVLWRASLRQNFTAP